MAPIPTPWHALRQRWESVLHTPTGQSLVSPCVSVCTMHAERDECLGCLRSIGEIAQWGMSTPAQQREIWQRLGQRIAQHFNEN